MSLDRCPRGMEGIFFSIFYSLVEKRISIDIRFGKFNDAAISTLIDLHLSSRSILILFRRFFFGARPNDIL